MFSGEFAANFHSEFPIEHPQGVAFNTNKKDKDSVIYVVMSSVMFIANLQQIWPIIQMVVWLTFNLIFPLNFNVARR